MTSYVGVYQGDPGIKNCPPEALLSQPWYMGWMLHLPAGFVILCTLVWIIWATGPKFVLARKNVTVYTWEPITKKKLLRVSQKIFWQRKSPRARLSTFWRCHPPAHYPSLCNFWHPQIHRKHRKHTSKKYMSVCLTYESCQQKKTLARFQIHKNINITFLVPLQAKN